MALLWSALASGRVALMTHVLDAHAGRAAGAGWVTYVRCHDDIGWSGTTPEDAAAVGEDAHLHRRFLSDFYAGEYPGTFARDAPLRSRTRRPARRAADRRVAGRGSSGGRRRARARAGDPARAAAPCRRVRPRRSAADLHGRRARAAQRSAWADDEHRRATTAGCTARRWTGGRGRAARGPGPVEAALWDGLRRIIAARRATRATHAPGRRPAAVDGQRPRLRAAPRRIRRRPAAGAGELQRRRAARSRDPIVAEHGLELEPRRAGPDGRSVRAGGRRDRPRSLPVLLAQLAWMTINALRRVHAGHRADLPDDARRHGDLDGRRRDAERRRPQPDRHRPPGERRVRAAAAAPGARRRRRVANVGSRPRR